MNNNLQEKVRKALEKASLKDTFPIEKRKEIMSRLMTTTLVIAWLPIFTVIYGVFYKFIFQPLKDTENADLILIAVVIVSSVGSMIAFRKLWKTLQQKIFTVFEGNEQKNIR
ncbi:MAG: hypothetical protein HGB11_05550 [Chlorobiales bacterium]|jgi:hypothetical protein|nr:hypothetical protein [Chlorobiales bacterium]